MDLALKQLNIVEAAELLPSLAQARGFFSQMPNPILTLQTHSSNAKPNLSLQDQKKSETGNLRCKVESRNRILYLYTVCTLGYK
jgi:hypothetical protein